MRLEAASTNALCSLKAESLITQLVSNSEKCSEKTRGLSLNKYSYISRIKLHLVEAGKHMLKTATFYFSKSDLDFPKYTIFCFDRQS